MRTVNSDCLADKFGGRLEISIIAIADGFAAQTVGTYSEFPHSVSNPNCTEFGLGMWILNADAGIVSVDIGSSTETFGYHRSSRVRPHF